MSKTRGYKASWDTLKSVGGFLKENIEKKGIGSIPPDIKKLLKDIDEANGSQKVFSPERAIKLRGVLVAFFSINDISPNKETTELIDGFKSIKTLGNAALYFSNAFDEIYSMLDKYPFREFLEAKLYFVDLDARDRLIFIRDKLASLTTTQNEKRKLKFNKIVNFLNPDHVSKKYSVSYKSKYQYISKEESLEKYLPAHFEITLNKIEKEYRELLKTHTFSEKKKQQILVKKEIEIKKAKDEYAYITKQLKQNSDLDVKILSYEHSSLYPEIKFLEERNFEGTVKYATKQFHLRSEVVNVLWYKPSQLKKNNTVADILQNYNHAFGDVYYIEKHNKK
ncbi:hypothetical protein [Sulfurimonas sp.]